MSREELLHATHASPGELEAALVALKNERGGIVLVDDGTEVELRAAPEASKVIEDTRKEAFSRGVGRAGLEVLTALLYRGSLTRAEVDFLRGVNSSQTLRTLASRGLVRKIPNPKDERLFLYEPTTELLSAIGLTHPSDLPQYAEVRKKFADMEAAFQDTKD